MMQKIPAAGSCLLSI